MIFERIPSPEEDHANYISALQIISEATQYALSNYTQEGIDTTLTHHQEVVSTGEKLAEHDQISPNTPNTVPDNLVQTAAQLDRRARGKQALEEMGHAHTFQEKLAINRKYFPQL